MASNQTPLTKEGAERLKAELDRLKKVDRPQVIQAIADARAHGDLKENAEYHAAREQQGFIEARIADLENALARARIIDVSQLAASDKVVFGVSVLLYDEQTEEESTWQIVGDLEADIKQRRLSISSPLARALIGREQGEQVEVDAPSGTRTYEIVEVRYG